jgi:hypothetical protein
MAIVARVAAVKNKANFLDSGPGPPARHVYATVENHQHIQRIIRIIDVPEDDPNLAQGEHRVEEAKIIMLKYFSVRQMQQV